MLDFDLQVFVEQYLDSLEDWALKHNDSMTNEYGEADESLAVVVNSLVFG